MAELECDCCSRDATSGQDFLCVSCARSGIYLLRLESTKILLEKEGLSKEIEAAAGTIPEGSRPTNHAQIAWCNETLNAEKATVRARIDETRPHIQTLQQEMENMRDEIAKRKADLIDRRKNLDVIAKVLPPRRKTALSTIEEIRDKGTTSFNNVNSRLILERARLCQEAAGLLRLRLRRRLKDGEILEQYTITGILLPDLREINTLRCIDLTAALNSVAHLLSLLSFYLGIRLPSEITLQHRNYPLTTINTPASSYHGQKIPFPGSGSSSASNSPYSSKHDITIPHRPRPLFIGSDERDEKIAKFAKRDPSAFNFFVEGISLLAWNIAWLCRAQGFTAGTTSWEDVCNMGKNLSTLVAPPQSAAMQRVLSDRDARRKKSQSPTPPTRPPTIAAATQEGRLGSMSHHTSHPASLLTLPRNYDSIRSWKLSKHQLISDSLKKHLLTEMTNAEWELLDEQEWNDGGEAFEGAGTGDGAVFIGAQRVDAEQEAPTTGKRQDPSNEDHRNVVSGLKSTPATKSRGSSGWTKVRGREK